MKSKESGQLNIEVTHTLVMISKEVPPKLNDYIYSNCIDVEERLEYKRPVLLLRGEVNAPFSMGQTKRSRCTVLPNRDYTEEELSMIFSHELHHLQRCDVGPLLASAPGF